MNLKIKIMSDKIGDTIPKPYYATDGAAGMDLHACIDRPVVLKPGERTLVPSGIAAALPSNEYAAFVFARSGAATKHGIALSNGVGVVDSDYRGEIKIGLINLSGEEYTVNPGDRIAQMVIMPVCRTEIITTESLDETERAGGGFGSTGR